MIKIPTRIPPFDFLQFISRQHNLQHVYGFMEIQLQKYKESHPMVNTLESEDRILILKEHHGWMYRLQNEYETICRVNSDYVLMNMKLLSEVEKLKSEVDKLTKTIDGLCQ